jgi:quercetin dioxygenase-like cupin family protein
MTSAVGPDPSTSPLVVPPGEGLTFDWANDAVRVLSAAPWSNGAVTVVEDTLKPGFMLGRHHHKRMTEVFYVLEGVVEFAVHDQPVQAVRGMVITVPPNTPHGVHCPEGATMLTVFVPGGFDLYLAEVAELVASGKDSPDAFTELGHRYDIWPDA